MDSNKQTQLVKNTRWYRKIHKYIAIPVFMFMFWMGVTGLLLGWKKQTELLPKTEKSVIEIQQFNWLPMDTFSVIGISYLRNSLGFSDEILVDRLDVRPKNGIVKVLFKDHFVEVQIDGSSGEVLSSKRRYSDLIEKIHDGSILDFLVNNDGQFFKLLYTTWVSLSLIILSISGFFLWANPIRIRNMKKK